MNAQTFLNNFGYLANAPEGVKRLRETILHLAVTGNLVEQNYSEGQAEKDVEQAEILRKEFQKRYNIRKRKPIGQLRDEEIPFSLPVNWKWARMESVACYIQRGKGPKYSELGRARVVSQKCIQWTGFDLTPARRISDETLEKYGKERFLNENDILWNSTGTGTAGRVALYFGSQDLVVADSHVTVIRLTNFISQYVWCYLASPTIQAKMAPNKEGSMVSGTTNQVELSTSKVSDLPVPIPPIAEQKRIVAKVDELMALCDKLEAQQQERERRFPVLSRASHVRYVESPTMANLKAIFEETETVSPEDFRKSIFSLAVQGKLETQKLEDEPAEELLKRIKLELTSDLRRKSAVALPPVPVNLQSYEIPKNWCWARFRDIAIIASNLVNPRDYHDALHLAPNNIEKGNGVLLPCRTIQEDKVKSSNHRFYNGQIVYSKIRPNLAKIVIVDFDGLCSADMYPINALINKRYLLLYMLSEPFLAQAVKTDTRVAMPKINQKELNAIAVPVPPLQEQSRIVTKVDRLMSFVNQLEKQQSEKVKISEAFALSVVSAITGSQIKEQKKMKAPKTELITKLQVVNKPRPADKSPLANLIAKHKGELSAKALWQQSGMAIDAFYQQLKTEMANGWIGEPEKAVMKEVEAS